LLQQTTADESVGGALFGANQSRLLFPREDHETIYETTKFVRAIGKHRWDTLRRCK
jgi:hypothetical protein